MELDADVQTSLEVVDDQLKCIFLECRTLEVKTMLDAVCPALRSHQARVAEAGVGWVLAIEASPYAGQEILERHGEVLGALFDLVGRGGAFQVAGTEALDQLFARLQHSLGVTLLSTSLQADQSKDAIVKLMPRHDRLAQALECDSLGAMDAACSKHWDPSSGKTQRENENTQEHREDWSHLFMVLLEQCRSREQLKWRPAVRWMGLLLEYAEVQAKQVADIVGVLITLGREASHERYGDISASADATLRALMARVGKSLQEKEKWGTEAQAQLVSILTKQLAENVTTVRLILMEWLDFALSAFPVSPLDHRAVQRNIISILAGTKSERVASLALQVFGKLVGTRVETAELPETISEMIKMLQDCPSVLEQRLQQVILTLCEAIGAESAFEAVADMVSRAAGCESDNGSGEAVEKAGNNFSLARLLVHEMNLLLLAHPSLHLVRARLPIPSTSKARSAVPDSASPQQKGSLSPRQMDLFHRLYRPWCVHPAAALGLCLVAGEFELAERLLVEVTGQLQVRADAGLSWGSAALAQDLDQLARLILDTPVFACVRLRLLDPAGARPLQAALQALLLLLPQSEVLVSFRRRLSAAPASVLAEIERRTEGHDQPCAGRGSLSAVEQENMVAVLRALQEHVVKQERTRQAGLESDAGAEAQPEALGVSDLLAALASDNFEQQLEAARRLKEMSKGGATVGNLIARDGGMAALVGVLLMHSLHLRESASAALNDPSLHLSTPLRRGAAILGSNPVASLTRGLTERVGRIGTWGDSARGLAPGLSEGFGEASARIVVAAANACTLLCGGKGGEQRTQLFLLAGGLQALFTAIVIQTDVAGWGAGEPSHQSFSWNAHDALLGRAGGSSRADLEQQEDHGEEEWGGEEATAEASVTWETLLLAVLRCLAQVLRSAEAVDRVRLRGEDEWQLVATGPVPHMLAA